MWRKVIKTYTGHFSQFVLGYAGRTNKPTNIRAEHKCLLLAQAKCDVGQTAVQGNCLLGGLPISSSLAPSQICAITIWTSGYQSHHSRQRGSPGLLGTSSAKLWRGMYISGHLLASAWSHDPNMTTRGTGQHGPACVRRGHCSGHRVWFLLCALGL